MTSCNATLAAKAEGSETYARDLRAVFSTETYRVETLMLAYAIRPELAVMLAALVFGGAAR